MTRQQWEPWVARLALVSVCVLMLVGCTGNVALGPEAVKGQTPDGTVEMHEVQAAYIGIGSGGGVLCIRQGRNGGGDPWFTDGRPEVGVICVK
jgi:hypothetical protein